MLHDFTQGEGSGRLTAVGDFFYMVGWNSLLRLDTAGNVTTVHAFSPYDSPGFVVQGSDGDLYGTTRTSVFRLNLDGTPVWLHERLASDSSTFQGGLSEADDGNFYGTTTEGSGGTVYRVDPLGNLTTIYAFGDASSGDATGWGAGLLQAANGYLYGTSRYGGAGGWGAVYRLDLAGNETVVHSFFSDGSADGSDPRGSLLEAQDGFLYGTAVSGGDLVEERSFASTLRPSSPSWRLSQLQSPKMDAGQIWEPVPGLASSSGTAPA
jgi:uncharacterized repeat protein (TIGR03803 family)